MKISSNVSLKPFNTFGVEAHAECFAEIHTRDELLAFLKDQLPRLPAPLLILGGGSNMLFTRDVQGTVLKISTTGMEVLSETDEHVLVKAQAGENWEQFVDFCVSCGWGGLENLSLIPGNTGSAPMQNIGAYGIEIKDCFHSLEALSLADLTIRTFSSADCRFGYRTSVFKTDLKGKYLILSVTFSLSKQAKPDISYPALAAELKQAGIQQPGIADIAQAVKNIRRRKLPDPTELGNAGSFFKNPVISAFDLYRLKNEFPGIVHFNLFDGNYKLAAGWLIEQCGWKGYREGDAGVHQDQALILVNHGNATGREMLALAGKIQASVHSKFAVMLEPEVNVV